MIDDCDDGDDDDDFSSDDFASGGWGASVPKSLAKSSPALVYASPSWIWAHSPRGRRKA